MKGGDFTCISNVIIIASFASFTPLIMNISYFDSFRKRIYFQKQLMRNSRRQRRAGAETPHPRE